MLRNILTRIGIIAVIGLLLIVVLISIVQNNVSKSTQNSSAEAMFIQIEKKMLENDAEITELKASLDKEYIEKAHAFAEMIALNPSILEDSSELLKIQDMLDVDELHVSDEKGILLWGTIEGYFGFDFASSEQAAAFVPILTDSSYELAQEPTPNSIEGKLFQYVGVSRVDKHGIVQVGITPERLEKALEDNKISNVVDGYSVGSEGFVFAVNAESGLIEAFSDDAAVGLSLSDLEIETGKENGYFSYDNVRYYYNYKAIGDYLIFTAIPQKELQRTRNAALVTMCFAVSIVIAALVIFVGMLLRNKVIKSINSIGECVQEITDGNMTVRVNENSYEEFKILSDGINTMVETIDSRIKESSALANSQSELISNVTQAIKTIDSYSYRMTDSARDIASGATTQAATVEELSAFCDSISNQVKTNSENATKASSIALQSQNQLEQGMQMLAQMNTAMDEMNEASKNIGQVIKNVSDIAFQTNILALNASVEAARAGSHGRGFAVVAEEVRNLASKSAEAASSTAELIDKTLKTVEKGQKIAGETSVAMERIFNQTKESTELIESISEAANQQAESIDEITRGVAQISEVIQNNVSISGAAEDIAEKLSAEAGRLNSMVNRS